MSNPGMPLAGEDWQSWVEGIAALSAKLGMEFSQSHAHFYNFLNPAIENRAFHDEMIRRSCIASGMLGVKWMTVHAATETQTKGYSQDVYKRQPFALASVPCQLAEIFRQNTLSTTCCDQLGHNFL